MVSSIRRKAIVLIKSKLSMEDNWGCSSVVEHKLGGWCRLTIPALKTERQEDLTFRLVWTLKGGGSRFNSVLK